jgi:hypothetical protein
LYICYNCSVIPGWRACCSSSLQYPTVAYSPTKSQGCVSRPGHRTGNRRKFNFCFNSSDAPSQFLSCGKGFDSEWQSRFVWIEPVGRHHCKNHAAGICAQKHAIKPIPMTNHEMQVQITYKQLNPFLFFPHLPGESC